MERWSGCGEPRQVYLKPGELLFTQRAAVITTVLGSCIAATFLHRASGHAAICHAMQPRCPHAGQCPDACPRAGRYAACAVEAIVQRMKAASIRPRDIEVKLFGGAALIVRSRLTPASISMGRQNVIAARQAISAHGLILKVADVEGAFGRKIIFNTRSGEVLMKRLHRTAELDGIPKRV